MQKDLSILDITEYADDIIEALHDKARFYGNSGLTHEYNKYMGIARNLSVKLSIAKINARKNKSYNAEHDYTPETDISNETHVGFRKESVKPVKTKGIAIKPENHSFGYNSARFILAGY